jgi:fatty acid-binding protein DegV
MHRSRVKAIERVRTQPRARSRLLPAAIRLLGDRQPEMIAAQGDGVETPDQLVAEMSRRWPDIPVLSSPFTAVMTAHTGPGVIGLAFTARQ